MVGQIFTISTLFALARRAAREAKMEELRIQTTLDNRGKKMVSEQVARERNIERMRGTSRMQMQMALADAGVSPTLTTGPGGVHASHIQRAAANQALAGSNPPAGRLSYGY